MKYIKIYTDDKKYDYINPAHIMTVVPDGQRTKLVLLNNKIYIIKESCEEVMKKLVG